MSLSSPVNKPFAPHYYVMGGAGVLFSLGTWFLLLYDSQKDLLHRLWPFVCGFAVLAYGLAWIFRGLKRGLPALDSPRGLAKMVSQEAAARGERQPGAFEPDVENLRDMLTKRTFMVLKLETPTDQLLHALLPASLFSAPPALEEARRCFSELCFTVILVAGLVVGIFFELIVLSRQPDYAMFAWTLLIYLAGLATVAFFRLKLDTVWMIAGIFAAAFITVLLMSTLSRNFALPMPPAIPFILFGTAAILAVVQFYCFFAMFKERLARLEPGIQVSEAGWQIHETAQPEELFHDLRVVFDERRLSKQQNNCYLNFRTETVLGREENNRKGEFSGELMLETPPVQEKKPPTSGIPIGWLGVALCVLGMAGLLLRAVTSGFELFTVIFVLFVANAGLSLLGAAEFFQSEVLFRSSLLLFQASGSFTTVKLEIGEASGAAGLKVTNESTRVVGQAKLYVADVVSVVFAKVGSASPYTGVPRFVLDLNAEQDAATAILTDWKNRLTSRDSVAQIRYRAASSLPGNISQAQFPIPPGSNRP